MDIQCISICLGGSLVLIAVTVLVMWIIFARQSLKKRMRKTSQQQTCEKPAPIEKKDVGTSPIATIRATDATKRKQERRNPKQCSRSPSNAKIEQNKGAQDIIANHPKVARSLTSLTSTSQPEVFRRPSDESIKSPCLKKAKSKETIGVKDLGQPVPLFQFNDSRGYVCMKGASKTEENFATTILNEGTSRNANHQSKDLLDKDGYLLPKKGRASDCPNSPRSPTFTNASPIPLRNNKTVTQQDSLGNIPEEPHSSQESLYIDGSSIIDQLSLTFKQKHKIPLTLPE